MLHTIQRFKFAQLFVVSPILQDFTSPLTSCLRFLQMMIQILQRKDLCSKYDLSSFRFIRSSAIPLGEETMAKIKTLFPTWTIAQVYGMTKTAIVLSASSEHDKVRRKAGSLLPGCKVKLIAMDETEIRHTIPPEKLLCKVWLLFWAISTIRRLMLRPLLRMRMGDGFVLGMRRLSFWRRRGIIISLMCIGFRIWSKARYVVHRQK